MHKSGPLLSKCLAVTASTELKTQILKSCSDLLLEEDRRVKQESKQKEEDLEAPKEETSSTGWIQYTDHIIALLLDVDHKVRSSAVTTVNLLIRHGYINPIAVRVSCSTITDSSKCVSFLVALEADQQRANSEKAHRLLMHIDEKHPQFITMRIMEGIKLSYTFQVKAFGKCEGMMILLLAFLPLSSVLTSQVPDSSIFAELYLMLKPKQKINLLTALLKLFEEQYDQVRERCESLFINSQMLVFSSTLRKLCPRCRTAQKMSLSKSFTASTGSFLFMAAHF